MSAKEHTALTALITGASKGLGRTLATFLAAQGYHLIVNARDGMTLNAVTKDFAGDGITMTVIAGDVQEAAVREALADAVRRQGRLDLLFNNASTLGPLPMLELADYPIDALSEVFAINTLAPLALIQLTLPQLQAAQGLVVNVSSDAAVGGYAGWGGYGASKAALDLISATLANELHDTGVAVVSVDPGDMRTDMKQDSAPQDDISDLPLPEETLPFWAWLIGQERMAISGRRFEAQGELWTMVDET